MYQTEIERKKARKITQKHYRQSEKGKAARKKYCHSDIGRESIKAANKRHSQTAVFKAANKRYRQSDAGKAVRRDFCLKKTYNIGLEDYNKVFAKQKGCCAICGRHQSMFKKRLGVDHNHKTGMIRGLLCDNCNQGLGKFNEDVDLLNKAIAYLASFGK